MVTLAVAVFIGALVAGAGLWLTPRDGEVKAERVLRTGVVAALPGVALGLLLVEDVWLDTHAASLATSVFGSTLGVLGAAFLPREPTMTREVPREPGFADCLAWVWRVRASRRAPAPARSSTARASASPAARPPRARGPRAAA